LFVLYDYADVSCCLCHHRTVDDLVFIGIAWASEWARPLEFYQIWLTTCISDLYGLLDTSAPAPELEAKGGPGQILVGHQDYGERGVQGRAPGHRVWGARPPEAESRFLLLDIS